MCFSYGVENPSKLQFLWSLNNVWLSILSFLSLFIDVSFVAKLPVLICSQLFLGDLNR